MFNIKAVFIEKIIRTGTITSFRFKPENKIDFLPGQFLQVIFDEQNLNNRSLNKYLSFSCAPGKNYIEVTKRVSTSEFSKSLINLKEGDRIQIKAPMGICTFNDDSQKIGFLIGGIGITPVISILEHIIINNLKTDVILLYSNKTEDEIAFKSEIDIWSEKNKKIKPIYLISDDKPKDKRCFRGRIDEQFLLSKVNDYYQRKFFIFGPPKMVTAMKNLLLGVNCINENIKTENFIGY